mmetsp:Transcript_76521/g.231981  ORF Transcript_76521/g.231981 Transcript_76521/m.231981 type:complete len:232 (-) Transcript_76521:37-732(-)
MADEAAASLSSSSARVTNRRATGAPGPSVAAGCRASTSGRSKQVWVATECASTSVAATAQSSARGAPSAAGSSSAHRTRRAEGPGPRGTPSRGNSFSKSAHLETLCFQRPASLFVHITSLNSVFEILGCAARVATRKEWWATPVILSILWCATRASVMTLTGRARDRGTRTCRKLEAVGTMNPFSTARARRRSKAAGECRWGMAKRSAAHRATMTQKLQPPISRTWRRRNR